jgi:hypothetical protein
MVKSLRILAKRNFYVADHTPAVALGAVKL